MGRPPCGPKWAERPIPGTAAVRGRTFARLAFGHGSRPRRRRAPPAADRGSRGPGGLGDRGRRPGTVRPARRRPRRLGEPGRPQGPCLLRPGRRAEGARIRRGGRRRRGGGVGARVRPRRRGLLRRRDRPARQQRPPSARRLAHRRPQALEPGLRRRCRAAADLAHGLGVPARPPAGHRGVHRHPARGVRRGRCRLDGPAARPPHRADPGRYRVADGVGGLGPCDGRARDRRPPRPRHDRPCGRSGRRPVRVSHRSRRATSRPTPSS